MYPDEEPFNFPRGMFNCSFPLHKCESVLANMMEMLIRTLRQCFQCKMNIKISITGGGTLKVLKSDFAHLERNVKYVLFLLFLTILNA